MIDSFNGSVRKNNSFQNDVYSKSKKGRDIGNNEQIRCDCEMATFNSRHHEMAIGGDLEIATPTVVGSQ